MNFSQYMSAGQGGEAAGGTISDLGLVCFEDGTCMPGSSIAIGTSNDPSGIRTPPREHRTYADGTGGHFLYGRHHVFPAWRDDGTGGAYPRRAPNPEVGRGLALLLDLLKRHDTGPERRQGVDR